MMVDYYRHPAGAGLIISEATGTEGKQPFMERKFPLTDQSESSDCARYGHFR